MARPLNEFAGWLSFFQIWILFNLLLSVFTCVILLESLFSDQDKLLTLGETVQFIFIVYMLYRILKTLRIPSPEIPEQIKQFLFNIFIVAALHFIYFTVVTMFVYGRQWAQINTVSFAAAVQTMLWAAIWRTYFEKSKRVDAYFNQKIDYTV
jgi:hypothetical protein